MRKKDRWFFMRTMDNIACRRYLREDSLKKEERYVETRDRKRDSLKKVERDESQKDRVIDSIKNKKTRDRKTE